jgi:integrative and conjugative element protein (TIGR02256 family)
MLTIHLTPEVRAAIIAACKRSGVRETGGMLFGEHVSENVFRVVEATVAGTGSIASFVRGILDSLRQLDRFFHRTRRDYQRFNYLGEWHSHPSFELHPSATDDRSMFDIVNDPGTGARFALSLIVKLVDQDLEARAFVYFPGDERQDGEVAR